MAAYYQPLTLRHLAQAFAFLRDCEDDSPFGLPGENGPARRTTHFGAHVETPHDEEGRSLDRVDSFEDELIARLDGEVGGDDDEGDEVAAAFDEAMAELLDEVRITTAFDEPAPAAEKAPASLPCPPSLERLPRRSGMGHRKSTRRAGAKVTVKRAA